jgi:hypothetical protein
MRRRAESQSSRGGGFCVSPFEAPIAEAISRLQAPRDLTLDERVERVLDSSRRSAGDTSARRGSADVFGRPQGVPVGIEGLPGGGEGSVVAGDEAPAPASN